jgi:hypothetical protein
MEVAKVEQQGQEVQAAQEDKQGRKQREKESGGLDNDTQEWLLENGLGKLAEIFVQRRITKESVVEITTKTMGKLKIPQELRSTLSAAIAELQEV